MSKIAVFYGSSTGNTEKIAKKIAGLLEADVFDIGYSTMERIHAYNNLILGTSTGGLAICRMTGMPLWRCLARLN